MENTEKKDAWLFPEISSRTRKLLGVKGEGTLGFVLGFMLEYPEYETLEDLFWALKDDVPNQLLEEVARLLDGKQLYFLHAGGKIDPMAVRALLEHHGLLNVHSDRELLDDEEFIDHRELECADILLRNYSHFLLSALHAGELYAPPDTKLQEQVPSPQDRRFLRGLFRQCGMTQSGGFNAKRFKEIARSRYGVDFDDPTSFRYVPIRVVRRIARGERREPAEPVPEVNRPEGSVKAGEEAPDPVVEKEPQESTPAPVATVETSTATPEDVTLADQPNPSSVRLTLLRVLADKDEQARLARMLPLLKTLPEAMIVRLAAIGLAEKLLDLRLAIEDDRRNNQATLARLREEAEAIEEQIEAENALIRALNAL